MSQATAERVSMASPRLDAAWGPRPWSIDKVPQLRNEVEGSRWRTRDEAKGAGPAVFARNIDKIEKLEELAWILTTAGEDQLSDFFRPSDGACTLEGPLRNEGFLLCEAVQAFKARLFAAQNLPELRISRTGAYDPICPYCSWGFERFQQGRRSSEGKKNVPIPDTEYCVAYLCAVNKVPTNLPSKGSAIRGCHTCSLIQESMQSQLEQASHRYGEQGDCIAVWTKVYWTSYRHDGGYSSRPRYVAMECNSARSGALKSIFFHIETHEDTPEPEPLTDRNMAFLRQKIAPDKRGRPHVPDFVPSRLIDLGDSPEACPRLLNKITPSKYPKFKGVENSYVTLSYCWGPPEAAKKQLKLTSRNMGKFMSGIPLKIMSPVMRDAVVVCRKLEVRYLWIDAVCIMQDSKKDWEVESSKMCDIYTKSRFTICAASSSSCQEGFLAPTPDRTSPRLRIDCTYLAAEKARDRGTAIGPLWVLRLEPRGEAMMEFKHALDRDLALPDCSWSSRGWTYQEKTLAPHKLIFGRSMLHFIDESLTVSSEGGRWQRLYSSYGRHGSTEPKARANPITIQTSEGRAFDRPLQWQQVVEQYSEMQFSFHADVFPALSGAAAAFVQHKPDEWGWEHDEYLAGLWKMDLHCTLLWYGRGLERLPARSLQELMGSLRSMTGQAGEGESAASFTAPTWSWASRKHPIHFAISKDEGRPLCCFRYHMRPEYDLLTADVQVRGANPFGRLEAASLLVAAKLLPLTMGCRTVVYLRAGGHVLPIWKYWPVPGRPVHIVMDWTSLSSGEDGNSGVADVDNDGNGLQLMLVSSCCTCYKDKLPTGDNTDTHITGTQGIWSIYRGMIYSYLYPTKHPILSCPYCCNYPERDAWGLLLYPSGKSDGSYYRVGMWFTYGRVGGGLSIFDSTKQQNITLA